MSQLGRGGFSEVWRAFDLMDLKEVAVKIHQLDERWSDGKKANYTKHVSREYEIHRLVRHPRIVSLFDVFEIDDNSFATVLECCNGTDLDTILKDKRYLSEEDAYAILLQVLSGMRYLSSPSKDGERNGIIHYDLKPGNILLDEHGDAKITDFGLSKIVDAETAEESMELTSQGAGTYWYLPPECFIIDQNVRIRLVICIQNTRVFIDILFLSNTVCNKFTFLGNFVATRWMYGPLESFIIKCCLVSGHLGMDNLRRKSFPIMSC